VYKGTPKELEKASKNLAGLFEKREKEKGKTTLRHEVVIEGSIMYVAMIQTSLGTTTKKLKEDVKEMKKDKNEE
jgi:hypothetical protein